MAEQKKKPLAKLTAWILAIATLLTAVGKLISVLQDVRNKFHFLQSQGMTPAGYYTNPDGLMKNLTEFMEQEASRKPAEFYVIVDLASFGSVTYPELHLRYYNALYKLASQNPPVLHAAFLDDAQARTVVERQVSEDDWKTFRTSDKLKNWFINPSVVDAVLQSGSATQADLDTIKRNGAPLDFRPKFIACSLAYDDYLIKKLAAAAGLANVRRYRDPLSAHLWMSDASENPDKPTGLFGLVDWEKQIEEPGFYIRKSVHGTLRATAIEHFERAAPAPLTTSQPTTIPQ
ncbi:MAG TPA: hypothetical protein VH370_15505 [Humisphaera sp.]|jgi:hypothetical protein|nr:hypothetical protein [Humisphaera sp.]